MTKFLGTEMYWAVFWITAIEFLIGFYQVMYYLQRPSDRSRLQYLTLLTLLICYNLSSGFLPDPNIPIPVVLQTIIAYAVAITMTTYFAYYLYKTYKLHSIKQFILRGLIFALFVPFGIVFLIIYIYTLDLELSRKLFVLAPACFGIASAIKIGRVLLQKVSTEELHRFDAFSGYLAVLCWIGLPFIVFFGDHQVLEHSFTNFGFLVLTIARIRQSISVSHQEYAALKKSEASLKELNEDLSKIVKEKTAHLEKLMEQRKNMFVNVTHELRTPLTLILNQLYQFEKQKGTSEELDSIKKNYNKIARDIKYGFDIERINEGKVIFDHNQVANISDILNQAVESFKSYYIKDTQLNITASIQPNLCVEADPEGILAIINNLITNAIKYSDVGGSIEVYLEQKEETIFFKVKDHGIGIEESAKDYIFIKSYQDQSKKRSKDGMGQGLYIVKNIIDALNATIEVNSQIDYGTEFNINFKAASQDLKPTNFIADIQPYLNIKQFDLSDYVHRGKKHSILIVEDNLELLTMMRDSLKEEYNVYVAQNGQIALDKLETRVNIDLIISDIMMDGLDGLELFDIISNLEHLKHIPVFFLTAKSETKDRSLGTGKGAIQYITKPFHMGVLHNLIQAYFSNRTYQRKAYTKKLDELWDELHEYSPEPEKAPKVEHEFNIIESPKSEIKEILTNKEQEVVSYVIQMMTNNEIAEAMNVSSHTIRSHINNICDKLQLPKQKKALTAFLRKAS